MKYLLVLLFLVTGSAIGHASETSAEYADRIMKHIDPVRYDSIVRQASYRDTEKLVAIQFRVGADGLITNVRLLRSSVSAELGGYIIRAFNKLPPVKNVPKSIGAKSFAVQLQLGGKPKNKK